MNLHGLEVQYQFVTEEFNTRLEYVRIDPAFGRNFPLLPMKNN